MPPERLLFIRLDRIGDLILTLPVDSAFAGANVDWWVPKKLGFIPLMAVPRRQAIEVEKTFSLNQFFMLLDAVRAADYDAAVVFHAPWWISVLLWMARIPIRGGVKSQWHSFLFLNHAFRQKRSRAEHSELDYNYRLIEKIFSLDEVKRTSLRLHGFEQAQRSDLLKKYELKERGYTVVHPGMGGSAQNWSAEKYIDLILDLAASETIVVTGTKTDENILDSIRKALSEESGIIFLDNRLSGPELVTVLEGARAVIAPSTGVLHLAASTGRPTIGIFSPVRVQSARRWGPQGDYTATVAPNVKCPGELFCLGTQCPLFDCMDQIPTEVIFDIHSRLAN